MPTTRWLWVTVLIAAPQAIANQAPPNTSTLVGSVFATALPWLLLVLSLLALSITLVSNLKLKRKSRDLAEKHQLLDVFLQRSDDIIAILSTNQQPCFINPALAKHLNTSVLTLPEQLPLYIGADSAVPLLPGLELSKGWRGEAWLANGNNRLALSIAISGPLPPDSRYLLLGRDISGLKQQQQQLNTSTLYDADTGLYTPLLMTEYLHTLIQVSNNTQLPFAIMLVRLHKQLQPNVAAVDIAKTLTQLAHRMTELVGKGCVLARYSADTLAVMLPQHLCQGNTALQLNRIGYHILKLAEQTGPAVGGQLLTTIGVSVYSSDADSASELLLAASAALVEAAKAGRSKLEFADHDLFHRSSENLMLESELHKAIQQDEFELYYQPRMSIGSNRVIGYEALLRWHNPRRGILSPQYFLTVADETGLTIQLERLAFVKCCRQLQLWQKTDISRGRMALNVSALSLQQKDFASYLSRQLERFGLSAELFEFELEESALLQADEQIHKTLQQLTLQGFHLTLDNFGEGISALSLLRQQPLHSVKIAQSYIKDMEHNEKQRNITASLIRLATYLQLDVIATGIENEMQAYLLHVMGCDMLQGHLFSKALPAAEIPALLAKENRLLRKALN